jgi:autotransporter-associated beta strand protein
MKNKIPAIIAVLFFVTGQPLFADSATWNLNPTSSDWNTAANWSPNTVPNGPTDVATFGVSNTTEVTLSATSTEVAEIVFNPGASTFNITVPGTIGVTLTISGTGVVNNSGVTEHFSIGPSTSLRSGLLQFENAATAGTNTTYTAYGAADNGSAGSGAQFYGNSSAGSATFIAQGATHGLDVGGGFFGFNDNSTAENANFTINPAQNNGGFGGSVGFGDFATAGNAVFVLNPGRGPQLDSGSMGFGGNATAGNGLFILNPTTGIEFLDAATAGNGFFMNMGGGVDFGDFSSTGPITTAGNATIINEGGNGAGSFGGGTFFLSGATAGQALLVANGGENGGGPGHANFDNDSDGGEAQIEVYGDGYVDISFRLTPSVTIGSLAGDGIVDLGSNNLTVGSNNLDTTFAGVIQDGGFGGGTRGSLTKIGTGTLTLTGANTYTGGTVVNEGTLKVANTSGSGTGSRDVQVNAGTLEGKGIIAGAVTVGTGSGTGAFLAPGAGARKTNTLTIQGALTIKADGTYSYRVKTKRAEADQVIANGVTIESGAQFSFKQLANQQVTAGTVFTAIDNTSTNPIAGTFANLPDDSTFVVGNNTYQADYQGGDGNDLTLTVVP